MHGEGSGGRRRALDHDRPALVTADRRRARSAISARLDGPPRAPVPTVPRDPLRAPAVAALSRSATARSPVLVPRRVLPVPVPCRAPTGGSLQIAVRGEHRAEQADRLVRVVRNPVAGADPVGDQLVDVRGRPAVASGAVVARGAQGVPVRYRRAHGGLCSSTTHLFARASARLSGLVRREAALLPAVFGRLLGSENSLR